MSEDNPCRFDIAEKGREDYGINGVHFYGHRLIDRARILIL